MSSLMKLQIQNLNTVISNAFIVCTIIAKSNQRLFNKPIGFGNNDKQNNTTSTSASTSSPLTTQSRGVLTFTVRDAQHGFVNCILWGSDSFIISNNSLFKIGDVISIIKPVISFSNVNDGGDGNFRPLTSSPFLLTIYEGKGEIIVHDRIDTSHNDLMKLINIPIKSTSSLLRLIDINNSNINGQSKSVVKKTIFVDLLVVVRKLGISRSIFYEKEKQNVRDITVMDQTVPGMRLSIWNEAFIERSNKWQEQNTILQLIDVKVSYSKFHQSIMLTTHSRTLIVENPRTVESIVLKTFIATNSIAEMDIMNSSCIVIDLSTITDIMSVAQIRNRSNIKTNDKDEFTAIFYGIITNFDIDGNGKIFSRHCTRCKKQMKPTNQLCSNEDCILLESAMATGGEWNDIKFIDTFDLRISISDHTGTLENVRVLNVVTEKMLTTSLKDFLKMNITQKCLIKWNWLLQRCTIKLNVKCKTILRSITSITILDCSPSDFFDVSENIKVY